MKNLTPFLLILALGLYACGESASQQAETETMPATVVTPTARTAAKIALLCVIVEKQNPDLKSLI